MPFETYAALVAVAAVLYSFIARYVQNRFIDRKQMAELQAESKRLNEEYKAASKSEDKAKMDQSMQKQMELFPKMNKLMMDQFKPMIVILVIFFAFNWAITSFDPSKADDISLAANDNGTGCDKAAGDGIYTACYAFSGTDYGRWVVSATVLNGGSEIGANSTIILYGIDNTSDTFLLSPKGEPVTVAGDRRAYYPGERATITVAAPSRAKEVELTLDRGTSFYVDLPFAIPLLNVQRLHEPYWWFLFVAITSGIVISVAYGKLEKKGEKK